ncbi:MAG TPA: AAA family ATPase [Leptospiraceae bacterium]|nr:AAA family ATPase [Leptospiraceae bacterium]HMY66506.1 AAA family ATPase [Leptospiraceae bacterium]HNF12587.1 AAA family ATPase [Leptospiraceae bacterium]HNF23764.1 AAA family ATPase [Leptospiraceae bacterium]HNI98148.1 AAA family ATPase [Leptospiraceae bacterium]
MLNFKGGVGKTTLSVNFAAGIANTPKPDGTEYKVLLIDTDPQANASVFMLGEYWRRHIFPSPERTLYGILDRTKRGFIKPIDEEDIIGQFSENDPRSPVFATEKQIMQDGSSVYLDSDNYWPNLHLLSSHYVLGQAEKEIRFDEEGKIRISAFGGPIYYFELLDRVSSFIRSYYDFIIIDCAPNLYTLSECALFFCDEVIIPVIPDWLSTNGINWLVLQLKNYSQRYLNRKKIVRAIVPTLWNTKELVFSRHIRILNKSLAVWKRNDMYRELLAECEIWPGLQRLASVNKAIESLRPVADYQASEQSRAQMDAMVKRLIQTGNKK